MDLATLPKDLVHHTLSSLPLSLSQHAVFTPTHVISVIESFPPYNTRSTVLQPQAQQYRLLHCKIKNDFLILYRFEWLVAQKRVWLKQTDNSQRKRMLNRVCTWEQEEEEEEDEEGGGGGGGRHGEKGDSLK